jgi:hypothetical protein
MTSVKRRDARPSQIESPESSRSDPPGWETSTYDHPQRRHTAYLRVHSRATRMASASFAFQCWATSLLRGSSGFGAPISAWMERRTVRIWSAGDHLSVRRRLSSGKRRRRLSARTLENIKADSAELVRVRVIAVHSVVSSQHGTL